MLVAARVADPSDGDALYAVLQEEFKKENASLKKLAGQTGDELSNLFKFAETAFDNGNEMLIIRAPEGAHPGHRGTGAVSSIKIRA